MEEHIQKLVSEAKAVPFDTIAYWKLRCTYFEKSQDPTYSREERDNCYMLYKILTNNER